MTKDTTSKSSQDKPDRPPARPGDAARRALAEAEERRRAAAHEERALELNGRDGPEPTRYGDWEKKGIVSDF